MATRKTLRKFPFVKMDVFTSRRLEGNQLAVFTDARGLSDSEMQALAREMNLAETTFILPRDRQIEAKRGVRVRIFTVQEELPFAGHPTLGTAFVLRAGKKTSQISLDLNVGKIPVTFSEQDGKIFGEMRQPDPEFGSIHSREEIARQVFGVSNSAAGARSGKPPAFDDAAPIQTVSTGMPFAIVPLASLAALRELAFDWKRAAEYLARTDAKFLYFVARDRESRSPRFRARMIFYNGEDPATGSAAGCVAAWMVRHGLVAPDEQALIEQGMEISRPSQIFVRASRSAGVVNNVRVGGHAVQIMRGVVEI
jgi:trans-2,3-dihydro-3-hydroxyanthranilate isomerase